MKVDYKEFDTDYQTYRFAYTLLGVLEDGETLDEALELGFLPYSADLSDTEERFYMARSLRVRLAVHENIFSKKRRYELRRFAQDYEVNLRAMEKTAYLNSKDVLPFETILSWQRERFGEAYMDRSRYDFVLNWSHLRTVLQWKSQDQTVAIAFLNTGVSSSHYWYCFYDPTFANSMGLGSYCMASYLQYAAESKQAYAYLGTGYKSKSAYKTKGINSAEWWDGTQWSDDKEALTSLQCKD